MSRTLHAHQTAAIERLRQSLRTGGRRPMLQMPTGSGKTEVASAIIDSALSKGHRAIFAVPCISLVDQTYTRFWDAGIRDLGVMQADHHETRASARVQVVSTQTLARRHIPPAGVVLVDEAHKRSTFLEQWMASPEWAHVPFIGLSATPWTRGLGRHFDDLIKPTSIGELIEGGFLCTFRVLAPSHPDLSGVTTVAGDYHEGQLSERMRKPQLVADAIDTWRAKGDGRPTLVFGVDRAHAQMLQANFLSAGIPAGYIDAHTPRTERTKLCEQLKAGVLKVIVNVACMIEGVDLPQVSCISMCRPTKSDMLYTQVIGRGLRMTSGKRDLLVLDHSDNTLRLGMVTEIEEEHVELDDGTRKAPKPRKREERLPKECGACGTVKPVGVHACPGCGFAPKRQNTVKHGEGELVEVTRGKPRATPAEKQRWFSMLRCIQFERKCKDGWTAHKYREKFGVWPRGLSELPVEADAEVRSWVRSRDIAWARSAKSRKPNDAEAWP